MKTRPPHTDKGEASQEKWKTRPSTETTLDEGKNAWLAREHRAEENAPPASAGKAPDWCASPAFPVRTTAAEIPMGQDTTGQGFVFRSSSRSSIRRWS